MINIIMYGNLYYLQSDINKKKTIHFYMFYTSMPLSCAALVKMYAAFLKERRQQNGIEQPSFLLY